ncbi:MAG: hypothetical protein ABJE47_08860 [bacterium]
MSTPQLQPPVDPSPAVAAEHPGHVAEHVLSIGANQPVAGSISSQVRSCVEAFGSRATFLRELEADPALRSIPIVVVSAVASENRMQMHGAFDYLDKPVTREQLERVVHRNSVA